MILFFSELCTLVKTHEIKNDFGANVVKSEEKEVFCNVKSVGQNEAYQMAKLGYKGELKIEVYSYDFDEQTEFIKYNAKKYKIQRLYNRADGTIELTCVKAVINND